MDERRERLDDVSKAFACCFLGFRRGCVCRGTDIIKHVFGKQDRTD